MRLRSNSARCAKFSLYLLFLPLYYLGMTIPRNLTRRRLVRCKACDEVISTGSEKYSFQTVTLVCPTCFIKREYRPSEVFRKTFGQANDESR
jgi:hypothetical protein